VSGTAPYQLRFQQLPYHDVLPAPRKRKQSQRYGSNISLQSAQPASQLFCLYTFFMPTTAPRFGCSHGILWCCRSSRCQSQLSRLNALSFYSSHAESAVRRCFKTIRTLLQPLQNNHIGSSYKTMTFPRSSTLSVLRIQDLRARSPSANRAHSSGFREHVISWIWTGKDNVGIHPDGSILVRRHESKRTCSSVTSRIHKPPPTQSPCLQCPIGKRHVPKSPTPWLISVSATLYWRRYTCLAV